MSVLGARVEWGEKEETRQVMLEGVRKIVDGYPGKAEIEARPSAFVPSLSTSFILFTPGQYVRW